MVFLTFMVGAIVGGLIFAICVYYQMKGRYEKEKSESYNKGYKAGSETEKRAILDYIDLLASDPNACIYRDKQEGSVN